MLERDHQHGQVHRRRHRRAERQARRGRSGGTSPGSRAGSRPRPLTLAIERHARAPERVERGRHDLDRRVGDQAERVARQRARGLERRVLAEAAVLVDEADDRHAQQRQPDRRRHGQEQHHAQPAAQRRAQGVPVAARRRRATGASATSCRPRRRRRRSAAASAGTRSYSHEIAPSETRLANDELIDDVDLHRRHAQRRRRHQRGDPPRARIAQRAGRAAARGRNPMRHSGGTWIASCARPPDQRQRRPDRSTADARRPAR